MGDLIIMLVFGIIILIAGLALLVISILLCFGFINLLHDYHRNNVKTEDERKLGLSTGLSLMFGSFGFISSGIVAIAMKSESVIYLPLILLFVPLIISIVFCIIFIKKYNGSLFG